MRFNAPFARPLFQNHGLSYEIHYIASRVIGEAIHFRDVEIGVKKIEWMSVKNLARGWGGCKI